jgi:predicted nucleotidyltransferase
MDFARPIESLVPGVQGRILSVLAETDVELTMRAVASLAGASQNRTSELLNDLAALGVVERRDAGNASLVRLSRANAAARWVRGLASIADTVLAEMSRSARRLSPQPKCLAVFGSFVRRVAARDSDIDVVAVVDEESSNSRELSESLARWCDDIAQLTGNSISLVTVVDSNLIRWVHEGQPLWSAVVEDGEVLTGGWPPAVVAS